MDYHTKTAETPVISRLQALVSDISTGTKVPVENRSLKRCKHWYHCVRTAFARMFKVAPKAVKVALGGTNRSQGGTTWHQPGVKVALPGTKGGQPGTTWHQPQPRWHYLAPTAVNLAPKCQVDYRT